MKDRRTQPLVIHIAATLLLACGFVKFAEQFDPLGAHATRVEDRADSEIRFGCLPCGSNKK